MIWKVLDNKKRALLCTLLLGIGAGVFVFAFWGNGADAFPGLSNLANDVAVGFFEFIQAILASIVRLIGMTMFKIVGLLIIVGQYNGFINNEAVKTGWVIVRDVMNMFFVIVLLIIAISTILQQKNFAYQQMLPRLIVTALIINFSKTICGIFIDFSQVFMLTFFSAIFNASGANFAVLTGMPGLFAKGSAGACSDPSMAAAAGAAGKAFLALLWALVMIVIATIVILALLLMLIIRIITLWFLIILSPVAFFFLGIKDVQGIGKKWMDAFTQQVLFGPAVGFFLWLSLTVTQGVSSGEADVSKVSMTKVLGAKTAGEVEGFQAQSGVDSDCGNTGSMETGGIASMIVGMGLLIGTLVVAQQTSNAAGGAVSKFAMSGLKTLNPATHAGAWAKARLDEGGKRYGEAIKGGLDVARSKIPLGKGAVEAKVRAQEYGAGVSKRDEETYRKGHDLEGMTADQRAKYAEKAKGARKAAVTDVQLKNKELSASDPSYIKQVLDVAETKRRTDPKAYNEFRDEVMKSDPKLAAATFFKDAYKTPPTGGTLSKDDEKKRDEAAGKLQEAIKAGKMSPEEFAKPLPGEDYRDMVIRLRGMFENQDLAAPLRMLATNALAQLGELGKQPNDKQNAKDVRDQVVAGKMGGFADTFDKNLSNNKDIAFHAKYDKGKNGAGEDMADMDQFLMKVSQGQESFADLTKAQWDALGKYAESIGGKRGQMMAEQLDPKKLRKELSEMTPDKRKEAASEMTIDPTMDIEKRKVIGQETGRYDQAFKNDVDGKKEFADEMKNPKNRATFEDKAGKDTYDRGDQMAQFLFEKGKFSDEKLTKIRESKDDRNAFIRGMMDAQREARTNAAAATNVDDKQKWQEAEKLARAEILRMAQSTHVKYKDAAGGITSEPIYNMTIPAQRDEFKKNLGKKFKVDDLVKTDLSVMTANQRREMLNVLSTMTNNQLGSLNVAGENGETLVRETIAQMRAAGRLTPDKEREMKRVSNLSNQF